MHLVVTAGNTLVPIDSVRCLTNRFTGKTGARIALTAFRRGHSVCLITSHPQVIEELIPGGIGLSPRWQVLGYQTFEELHDLMKCQLVPGVDALVHTAAVSDYLHGGVFAPAPGTTFHSDTGIWEQKEADPPRLMDCQAGKVKSDHPELWLRLTRAPKLVDLVRKPWGFAGILVKFKLEVGLDEEALLQIAEKSRQHSNANWMVANTLESAARWAYIGSGPTGYRKVQREELPEQLLLTLEKQLPEQHHG